MSAYLSAVLACAAVTALTRILAPTDEKTAKYIKYISGLVSLSIIVAPVISALRSPVSFPEISGQITISDEYEYDMNEAIITEAERSVSATIAAGVKERFRIAEDDISVSATLDRDDPENLQITLVTVTLTGYGAWTDTEEIAKYIKENYDKNTEVEIRYE